MLYEPGEDRGWCMLCMYGSLYLGSLMTVLKTFVERIQNIRIGLIGAIMSTWCLIGAIVLLDLNAGKNLDVRV